MDITTVKGKENYNMVNFPIYIGDFIASIIVGNRVHSEPSAVIGLNLSDYPNVA
jgi:hypothetical protein